MHRAVVDRDFVVRHCSRQQSLLPPRRTYPTRPITMVLPFPAGSGIDVTARLVADNLSTPARPAGRGREQGRRQRRAGGDRGRPRRAGRLHHFHDHNSSQTAAPFLLKTIPYDPVKDFAPVSRMGNLPFIMVIGRSVPANDFAEFVAYAKANPGKLNYASSNSTGIVGGAMVSRLAGIQLTHVPYKSAPQAVQDLLRGEISMMFVDFPSGLPHVKSGAVARARGDDGGAQRAGAGRPLHEGGRDRFRHGVVERDLRAGRDAEPIVVRLNKELREIVADPVVYARLTNHSASTPSPARPRSSASSSRASWSSGAAGPRTPASSRSSAPRRRFRTAVGASPESRKIEICMRSGFRVRELRSAPE